MYFIDRMGIKRRVLYQKFYERGVALFEAGRVTKLTVSPWHLSRRAGHYLDIAAQVRGERQTYHVRTVYTEQGGIGTVTCDCAAFSRYPTICRHCVAALLALSHMEVPPLADHNTDLLIAAMERGIRGELPTEQDAAADLRADCKLNYDSIRGTWELTLRAGRERLYVVKDLAEFLEAAEALHPVTLGRGQTLVPDPARFEESSRALLLFVRDCYYDNKAYADKYYTRCPVGRLELVGGQFPALFSLLRMQGIPVHGRVDGAELHGLVEGTPDIQYTLLRDGEEVQFGMLGRIQTIRSRDQYYLFWGDTLYHVPPSFGELVCEITDALAGSPTGMLRVAPEQEARFNALVVTPLAKQGLIAIAEDLRDTYRTIPLVAKVYLDYEDGAITARVAYCYEDEEYTVRNSQENPYRDVQQEYAIENLFAYSNFTMQTDRYVLPDEGDNLYDFLQHHLEQLGQLAQVYLSDAFKKIRVQYPRPVSAGVRLDGELLTLTLDLGEYSAEELLAVLAAYRMKKRYFRLRNGAFLNLENDGLEGIARLVDGLDVTEADMLAGRKQLPKYRALYLDLLARDNTGVRLERGPAVKQMVRDIRDAGDSDFAVPDSLKKVLRPYQKTGYRWMCTLAQYDMCGILADDMGLGKTLQVITLLLSAAGVGQPALVVVPTSLLYNWQSEFARFAPSLRVLLSVGSVPERAALLSHIADYDVVVTSYELLKRDIALYEEAVFSYCILDEAQNIKNHATQNAHAVKRIRAAHRFALTGTPIENALSELWSIFDFLMPGYLGTYQKFRDKYETPIVKEGDMARARELSQHVAPFLLRRLKKDVLKELPDKIESVVASDMTEAQREVYLAHLVQARQRIAEQRQQGDLKQHGMQILALLTRLRQVCCHPSLFMEGYAGGSGKFALALELIGDSVRAGHRVLLFSQFTQMLGLLGDALAQHQFSFFYLDGATGPKERMDQVERFNRGEREVFLISLKAGGNGLNLTGADVVIHYDPWWNPAVEDQATDRAYRIGQERKVQVLKLITKDTIEEKIQRLKEKKQGLIDTVVETGEQFVSQMSVEEIAALFDA